MSEMTKFSCAVSDYAAEVENLSKECDRVLNEWLGKAFDLDTIAGMDDDTIKATRDAVVILKKSQALTKKQLDMMRAESDMYREMNDKLDDIKYALDELKRKEDK